MSENKSKNKKITIIDVARHAGVGVSTVSRVINNKEDVNEDTKKKVLKSISELKYKPKDAARVLGRGHLEDNYHKTLFSVGLIANESKMADPFYMHIINGVEKELSQSGISCIFSQLREDNTSNNGIITKLLMEKEIDCVIGISIDDMQIIDVLKNADLPIVFIDNEDYGNEYDYIKSDYLNGSRNAMKYLISLGHERIAYLKGDEGWFFNDLENGYKQILFENNIDFESELIVDGKNSIEGAKSATEKLLKLKNPPTALISNDIMAIGAIYSIKDKGLSVPGDISVIGFDDIDASSYIEPTLTTIQVPKFEMGVIAARKAIEYITNKKSYPMKIVLDTKLIVRNSTSERTV